MCDVTFWRLGQRQQAESATGHGLITNDCGDLDRFSFCCCQGLPGSPAYPPHRLITTLVCIVVKAFDLKLNVIPSKASNTAPSPYANVIKGKFKEPLLTKGLVEICEFMVLFQDMATPSLQVSLVDVLPI